MVLFPNCKINLGLRVLRKRHDGFHDLDTVFYPLPLKDAAEIIVCPGPKSNGNSDFDLHISGLPIAGNVHDNLCYKAWKLIKNDFPNIPPVKMHLHKAIPPGAGLGGGSSNGAFTLMLLNQLLNLTLSGPQLINYAAQLGSDCAFFVVNAPCHARGRGEVMEQIPLSLHEYYFILVYPGLHINTGWAFGKLDMKKAAPEEGELKTLVMHPVNDWKHNVINDFEEPVFREYPQLSEIRTRLYDAGATYAAMTGTGSCIYGLFRKNEPVPQLELEPENKVYYLNEGD